MSIRDDFFAAKAKGSLWDVAVSIKRGNPLPLDADSIFDSYAALEAYAADVLAYPGQLVAVVNTDSTGIYYLDQNLAIHPVGVIPSGDGRTIEVSEDGIINLLGAKGAANGTLPMIGSEGKLEWKTLEDIGAGDGNDNTTYEITALEKGEEGKEETYGIQIQVKENGIATGNPIIIDFDVYTKSETDASLLSLETRIGERIDGLTDTTYSVKEGEKILKLEGTEFSTVASLKYIAATETAAAKIQLLGIDEAVVSEIDATPFIKDGMLEDVAYDADTNTITFTWNTESGSKTDSVVLSDIIEPYTAGAGLELSGNEFKVKIATSSDSYLTADENGLKLSGVQAAITAVQTEAAEDATNKANQALADAKADAANLYATKEYIGEFSKNGDYANVDTIVAYVNKKAEETLKAAQGGSSETAASVALALQNYKQENDPKVAANATAIETINEKLNTIESDADVNIIEKVKVNGSALTVDSEKAVNITVPTALADLTGWTSLDERVTTAKNQADGAATAANTAQAAADNNASEIAKHETRIGNLETAKGEHETRLLNLENADSTHAGEYAALKSIVDGHTTSIAGKADQTTLDSANAAITGNATAIQTINETTIPGVLIEVNKKANAADVYTKTEVGTIAEGKTLVQMISDAQAAATYDDTAIKGLLTNEVNRATEAEDLLSDRIAKAEAFLNEANLDAEDGSNNVIDTLKEIQSYIAEDKTGAAGMLSSINANTAAISTINNETSGILAQAKEYINSKITDLPNSGPIAGALLGFVKSSDADNKIKVESDGTMSVNRISTDKLYVAEGSELILNGGAAI